MKLVKRFERNTKGRDLIVGDIHGCFSKLKAALDEIGFNPDVDRLFSVGDLVDRGPESDLVIDWLKHDWFQAVQGNHEDMAIRYGNPDNRMDAQIYAGNGGSWNIMNPPCRRVDIADALSALPVAIQIETALGPVGIVHAECPCRSWPELLEKLAGIGITNAGRKSLIDQMQWGRDRIQNSDTSVITGVRAVVVGHTPIPELLTLGNTIYIDTRGWLPPHRGTGNFTILDAETLTKARRP